MPSIVRIAAADIADVLATTTRQYLVGELKRPQQLAHYRSSDVEVGISQYASDAVEMPHYHTRATEYQYVLSGSTTYLDHRDMSEHSFTAGDFFIIETGVHYSQRASAGTAILFIKVPPGDDKVVITPDAEVQRWLDGGVRGA